MIMANSLTLRKEAMWSSKLSVLQYLLMVSSCSDLFREVEVEFLLN